MTKTSIIYAIEKDREKREVKGRGIERERVKGRDIERERERERVKRRS